MMAIADFFYAHFNSLGRGLFKLHKGLEKDMEAANMKIHPEVYLSIVSFLVLVASSIPITFLFIFVLSKIFNPMFYLLVSSPPIIILVIGFLAPKMIASNRVSGLKVEIPYASMYMSVMASGGLSPYASLLRLGKTDLLPRLRSEIKRIQALVLSSGLDPVSAMERAAKVIELKEYKDLFLGYSSTLRTGGDVLHYLFSQTEFMFRNMATRIKAMGENMALLMEAYTVVEILGALGLYMLFIISLSLPEIGAALSPGSFFFFAFIALPAVSFVFIYLGDMLQIGYPVSYWKTYIAFLATLPLGLLLITQMVVPFLYPNVPYFPLLREFTIHLQYTLGFEVGCEPALGLAFSLIVMSIPVVIVDRYYSREERGILQGITSFLRDLVENRKTGLSPERCIQMLSNRDYGRFSKHLKLISSKLSWGFSLRKIFEGFSSKVKSWLAQVNMYLLVDTIETGGGTQESLETLAEFSESTRAMEKERKALLTPLIIVPYIGAALLTITTIMFLQFFSSMGSIAGPIIPYITLSRTLLTPLVLHSYMLGLVTGKIVSGRVSSGFKHAIFLTIASTAGIWIAPRIALFPMIGG